MLTKKKTINSKQTLLTQVPLEALSSELKDYLGTLKSKVRRSEEEAGQN